MNRYAQVPAALTFDGALSLGARATYPALRDLAWQAGRRHEEDATPLPPLDVIARSFGCSVTALKRYVAELRRAGWVETVRGPRNASQRYRILDVCRSEFASPVGQNPPHSHDAPNRRERGLGVKTVDESQTEGATAPSSQVAKQRPRNLVWDAIADACNILPAWYSKKSPIYDKHLTGQLTRAYGDIRDKTKGLPDEELANEVTLRAGLYRQRWPNIDLTPTALAKNWNVVVGPSPRRGLTPEEIAGTDDIFDLRSGKS